jgi:hypothetical protein
MWLAGVPIRVGRDKQIAPPTKLIRTPPPNIKRALAAMAIAEEQELERRRETAAPEIEAALQRARAGAEAEMKKLGYGDAQIAAHFERLDRHADRRFIKRIKSPPKPAKTPTVERVIAWARWRAPPGSLRRRRMKRKPEHLQQLKS